MASPGGDGSLRAGDLVLRRWRPQDRAPFAALNRDPEVGRYLLAPLTRAESDDLAARCDAGLAERGWGLWALDAPGLGFVGFVGLNPARFDAWFTSPDDPAVEIGWRLARAAWGRGWATAAAREVLDLAFGRLGLDQVVSFTAEGNVRSRRVMERLGLTRVADGDFDHPGVTRPEHAHLRRHVLYRIDVATHRGGLAGARSHEAGPDGPLTC